jgi:hypothetical protein
MGRGFLAFDGLTMLSEMVFGISTCSVLVFVTYLFSYHATIPLGPQEFRVSIFG